MARALVAVVFLLTLGLPVLAQEEADAELTKRVNELIEQLGDKDETARWSAAMALRGIGPAASPAVPALIVALSDRDDNVRYCATDALCAIGPKASVVSALAAVLSDEDKVVRGRAAEGLGAFGPQAAPAAAALAAALSDEDYYVRWIAAQALIDIGPKPAQVPALVEALSDTEFMVCVRAAEALGKVGPPAIPALIAALSDKSQTWWSQRALEDMGTSLKKKGTVLWWVVPRVYWKQLVGLLLLLVGWLALAARFPRHRPDGKLKHLALMALTAGVPVALCCPAVYYAITRDWAQGFLPDALTLVPFPVAAVLSTALVCALPAVWVCQRKQPGASEGSAG